MADELRPFFCLDLPEMPLLLNLVVAVSCLPLAADGG